MRADSASASRGPDDMSLPRFAIHPLVESASTIDKDFYLDPAVFARVRERVFARSWQWLGDAGRRRRAGLALAARAAARAARRAAAAGARRRRRAALPVQRLHASRQHPRAEACRADADPLRLPLAPLRPRRPHDLHARVRGRVRLPVGTPTTCRRCRSATWRGHGVRRRSHPRRRSTPSSATIARAPGVAAAREPAPRPVARPRLRVRRALGAVRRELPRGPPHPVRASGA